jgi:vitamin B12 transporter
MPTGNWRRVLCCRKNPMKNPIHSLRESNAACAAHLPRTLLLACAAALSMPSFSATAQSADSEQKPAAVADAAASSAAAMPVVMLPAVVVTASRLPQTLSDTIANTTLLTRADIERSGASDLPSLLFGQAGIEFGRNGGAGQISNIFMRGANSSQTLILIDGVPVNDNNFGTANLELLPLDAVERIEIVRGNVSAQYGSQAIGGVIQLFTRAPKAGLTGVASLEIGTQGHKKALASLAAGNKETQMRITVSQLKVDGISAKDASINTSANPDKDGTTQTAVQWALSHRLTQGLSVNASHLQNQQTVSYDGFGGVADADTAKQKIGLSQLGLNWAITSAWTGRIKLSNQTNRTHDETNVIPSSDVYSRRQLLSLTSEYQANDSTVLLAGIDRENNRFQYDSYGTFGSHIPTAHRNLAAYYVNLQSKYAAIGWNLALRRDNGDAKEGGSATSYQVGASYDVDPSWSFRGQISTAFKRPTLSQLYDASYGNLNLNPELARNKELGVQWKEEGKLLRLTAFIAKTRNLIDSDPDTYQNVNIAQSRNKGLEVLGESIMPWNGGKIKLAFNSQNPVDATTGEWLSRRAKLAGSIIVEGKAGQLFWNTALKYQGARDDSGYNDTVLSAYTRLDAGLGYAITPKADMYLTLSNLSHAKDQTAYGYSPSPRSVVLRFNYKL